MITEAHMALRLIQVGNTCVMTVVPRSWPMRCCFALTQPSNVHVSMNISHMYLCSMNLTLTIQAVRSRSFMVDAFTEITIVYGRSGRLRVYEVGD